MLIADEKESIDFLKAKLDISIFDLLENYSQIVLEQTKFFNLISKNTIDQIWQRHILDSYQLINYIDKDDEVIDIGSGAGFPGIVLKILGIKKLNMIDSINKKVIFINSTLEKLGFLPSAFHTRIENCSNYLPLTSISRLDGKKCNPDILTARALKPIKEILSFIKPSIKVKKKILLLKGAKIFDEIEDAKETWDLEYNLYPSITSDNSFVIEITKYTSKT